MSEAAPSDGMLGAALASRRELQAEVERLRKECEIGRRRNATMEETIERLRADVEGWRETHSTLVKQYNEKVAENERLRNALRAKGASFSNEEFLAALEEEA